MSLISFVVSIFPILLIGLLIYKFDKEKEPSRFLFKLFVLGITSCYPAAIISLILGNSFTEIGNMSFIELFNYVFITIAMIEELCKWFFLYKFTYNHKEFDSSYDMIVYAVFISLGFACFENVLYVFNYGLNIGLFRAISAVPGHACYGILMGIYLGIAKIKDINNDMNGSRKYKLLSILIPVVAHGIYDFCLLQGGLFFIVFFVIFIIFLDIYCIIKVKNISRNSLKFKNRLCISCGFEIGTKYCTRCGTKNI